MSMHTQPLTELERSGLEAHRLTMNSPSQLSDAFRLGMAWALRNTKDVADTPVCNHKWVTKWAHRDCEKCSSIMLGNSSSDREDYGISAGKIFKDMDQARFYQENGRLP